MKPISELDKQSQCLDGDAELHRYVDQLLRSADFGASQMRKRRVWQKLRRTAVLRPRRKVAFWVGGLVIGLSASASAMKGSTHWFTEEPLSDAPAEVVAPVPVRSAAPRVAVVAPQAPGSEEAESPAKPAEPPRAAAVPSRAKAKPAAATESAELAQQAVLVHDAMRALRVNGDAPKARELLRQYLREFPRGALGEEALALSIEANLKDDPKRAAARAKRYLKAYPSGRFVSLAQRALQ